MTPHAADERLYLLVIAAATLAAAIVFAIVQPNPAEKAPAKLPQLGGWLASHPADFVAASTITEQALDSSARNRFELWRAAYEHALAMSPMRDQARTAFVRSGLFHWYELKPRDQRDVLRNAEPLLRDTSQFRFLARPLYQLTRDFEFLHRNHPDDLESIEVLSNIAAMNGLFAEYRQERSEGVRERMRTFQSLRLTAAPPALLALVPATLDHDDEPLLRGVLDELQRRPLDAQSANASVIDSIVTYAMHHHVGPLTGIDAVVAQPGAASDVTRARLALHNGEVERAAAIQLASSDTAPATWADYFDERAAAAKTAGDTQLANAYAARAWIGHTDRQHWSGACGDRLCTRVWAEALTTTTRGLSVTLKDESHDTPPAYVEIYVDDTRVVEGEVGPSTTFDGGRIAPGVHPVSIRTINPFTPQARQRRLVLPPAPL